MNDEIVARFSSDTTGFNRGLQQMKQGTKEAGESAHASFIHAGNGAREFHKLLHNITEDSPLLGTALKAAISPIGAAIGGASLAFAFFKKQIEEFSARTDALEKGTDKPILNIKDALREAQKAVADFDRDWQKFQQSQNKTGAEKLVENLHEQLSLLDKQTAAVEKLSKADKDRLEHQKLLVTHGLQGRALFALNAQREAARADMDAANAGGRSIEGTSKRRIATAQGLISSDEEFIAKQQAELKFHPEHEIVPGMPAGEVAGLVQKNAARTLIEEQIRAAERRVERNKNTILREEEARKDAANRTAAARARFAGTGSAFDAMSISIENTRQAIVTSGGWGASAPVSSTDAWLADKAAKQAAWNAAHGIGDMVKSPISKNFADQTSNDIAELNQMFARVMEGDKLKVEMTVQDQ